MSPPARRTPEDQWRGPRAYSPNEPREFLMGRATDPWRAAETWIRCLASHSVPLHAATRLSAHPEVAHLPEEPSICHPDRFRRSRSAIRRPPRMVHASCPVRHQGAGWPALQAYRAIVDLAPVVAMSLFQSCRSALHPKALRARLLRGPPLKATPIGPGQPTTFTVYAARRTMPSGFGRRPSFGRRYDRSDGHRSNSVRHSPASYRASRKASRRSLGWKRVGLPRSYGLSFARAASLSARCAWR